MGETGEREGRVGVICESDLCRLVFIESACGNPVGKLTFMMLNMWMGVKWQGRENLCSNNSLEREGSCEKTL
jgi:hypothetical protein